MREAVPDGVLHLPVNEHRRGNGFAAVQHAVADGGNFGLFFDNTLFRIKQQGDDVFHAFDMGGEAAFPHNLFFLVRAGSELVAQLAHVLTEAFHAAGAQDGMIVHVEELVFARGRAGVDDQNFHGCYPLIRG